MGRDGSARRLEMYVLPPHDLSNPISQLYSYRHQDIILAACDVEGNFMVVKAYEYTDLLSCMLLDAYVVL